MTEQQPPLWRALVVGGEESFVKSRLSQSLAKHNIGIEGHLDWSLRRPPRQLPAGVDLVYICTDMVGHNLSEPCMNMARDAGIPYVNGTRKWAESATRLTKAGFPLLPASATTVAALPIKEIVETQPEAEVAVQAPIETSSDRAAVTADTHKEDQTMSKTANAFIPTNLKQREYILALIRNPTQTNAEIWADISGSPHLAGCKLDEMRCKWARIQLGITVTRISSTRFVNIDRDKFADTAIAVGANDCKIPDPQYVIPVSGALVVTTPEPTPSAPVVEAKPEAKAATSLVDAIRALREAMKGEGYIELVVTQDEVKFKRIQILEGTITL